MKSLLWLMMITFSLVATETKPDMHLRIIQGGLLSTKIIYNVLGSMGFKANVYRYRSVEGTIEMDLSLNGKKMFDPKYFVEMLREHQIVVQNGEFKKKQWRIGLDASRAFWSLPAISEDEGAQLERASLPYWFVVNRTLSISIEAPYGNKWYPEIAILDKNMQILGSFREFKPRDRMSFKMPEHAMYLKVSNANGMKMLKEGMWIEDANDEQQ
ncbi:MAG: hypothetical protein Q8K81_05050 [Sulfuricurvum sp.]|nr:hypothetical protein [Sulfuricurvum sp.]